MKVLKFGGTSVGSAQRMKEGQGSEDFIVNFDEYDAAGNLPLVDHTGTFV